MTCADEASVPGSPPTAARARWARFVQRNVIADVPAGHLGSLDEREWGGRRDRVATVLQPPGSDR